MDVALSSPTRSDLAWLSAEDVFVERPAGGWLCRRRRGDG